MSALQTAETTYYLTQSIGKLTTEHIFTNANPQEDQQVPKKEIQCPQVKQKKSSCT